MAKHRLSILSRALPEFRFICASVAAALSLSACASVQLVSRYDSQTDDAATAMQKDITSFFVKIDTAVTPADMTFAANQDFYKKEAVNISSMKVRAAAIPKNSFTQKQLSLIEENLAYMALLHKHCVTGPLSQEQKDIVRNKGIDPSLDCRKEFGATQDISGRGDQTLNPTAAKVDQSFLNAQLGAVIQLEIAKKRGDKSSGGE